MNTRLFDQWMEINQAAMAPAMRFREITAESAEKAIRFNLGIMQDCLELGNRQMQVLGTAQYPQDWVVEGGKNVAAFSLKMMGRVGDYSNMAKDNQDAVKSWVETSSKATMDSIKANVAAV
ncbi:MAG: phasin family protein [Pseudomonadota bacterium]